MTEKLILVLDDEPQCYPPEEERLWIERDFGCRLVFSNPHDPIASGLEQIRQDSKKKIAGLITDSFATPARQPFWHVREVRKLRQDLPICVHSGSLPTDRIELAKAAGADSCIPKGQPLVPFFRKVARITPLDCFWQDLPALLSTKFGKWVAYNAEEEIMDGDDEDDVYKRCENKGLKPGEYVVAQVLPDQPVADVPTEWE